MNYLLKIGNDIIDFWDFLMMVTVPKTVKCTPIVILVYLVSVIFNNPHHYFIYVLVKSFHNDL